MGKRDLITRELDRMPEQDPDKLVAFLRSLKEAHAETEMPALAAESSLAKDWLTPEEDAAWANFQAGNRIPPEISRRSPALDLE